MRTKFSYLSYFYFLLLLCINNLCAQCGAEWNPTGNPIGGGPGYSDSVTTYDYYVTTKAELLNALANADSGDIVYVADTAEINLTGVENISIHGGVTLASGRGRIIADAIAWGALLYTEDINDNDLTLFRTSGVGVRVTGLRLRGPYHYRAGRVTSSFPITQTSYGIFAWHDGLVVDNCELWGWSHSGIYYTNMSNIIAGYAHHNYIHEGQNCGQGLGVAIGSSSMAIIEANLFDFIRENVASVGDTNSVWIARYNIGLEHAAEHNWDRHGWPSEGDYGGKKTIIHNNTSRNFGNLTQSTIGGQSVRIRGEPAVACSIYNNWFYPSDSATAIKLWNGDTNCSILNNHYGTTPPTGVSSKLPIVEAHADVDSGGVPLSVSFNATGTSDPDGCIRWYEWDFGDNAATVRHPTANYTFKDIGIYIAELTVHDNDGIPMSDTIHIISAPDNDSFYISAWVNDRYHDDDTGFFFKQILVDDVLVWEDDVAECEGWTHVIKNVTNDIAGKDSVTITLRLYCKKNMHNVEIRAMETWWDDVALFWGSVKNGDFESGSGQVTTNWTYNENNTYFHGTWTSGDARSGDRSYQIFYYTDYDCDAGDYGNIKQRVAVLPAPGILDTGKKDNIYTVSYPCPNPSTNGSYISYQLPVRSNVSLKIYDINGRLVRTLVDEEKEPGDYRVNWDRRDEKNRAAVNGVYFCRFSADDYNVTRKLVLLR